MEQFKSLQGDFYVYSDIFSEGRPAYWSGYYTTRPFAKILDRQLEANLRSAEILFTWALNRAKQVSLLNIFYLREANISQWPLLLLVSLKIQYFLQQKRFLF